MTVLLSEDSIESYLGERKQCVKIESKTGELLDWKESGTPPGSVLAGVFHILNSNDIPDCQEEAESVSVLSVYEYTDRVNARKPEKCTKIIKYSQHIVYS